MKKAESGVNGQTAIWYMMSLLAKGGSTSSTQCTTPQYQDGLEVDATL